MDRGWLNELSALVEMCPDLETLDAQDVPVHDDLLRQLGEKRRIAMVSVSQGSATVQGFKQFHPGTESNFFLSIYNSTFSASEAEEIQDALPEVGFVDVHRGPDEDSEPVSPEEESEGVFF